MHIKSRVGSGSVVILDQVCAGVTIDILGDEAA